MPAYLPVTLRWLFVAFAFFDFCDAAAGGVDRDMAHASVALVMLLGVNTGLMLLVWLALICFFLVWYAYVLRWATTRGARVRGSMGWWLLAWFVPGLNIVYPYYALRTALRATGVRAPLGLWWSAYMAANLVLLVRLQTGLSVASGYVETALEVGAAVLGILVVSRVSAAAGSQSPMAAIAHREAELQAVQVG